MNTPTPTPTPRPALKATGMRRRHARCLETELAALTTERDRLRAELEKVYALVTPVGFDLPGGIFETAQACTELRAEVERLNAIGSWSHTCIHHTDEERKAWVACPCCAIARAERAEAELDGIRALADRRNKRYHVEDTTHQLVAALDQALDIAQAELATERARTKQIATALTDAISTYFGADKLVTAERIEAWQAALKGGAK